MVTHLVPVRLVVGHVGHGVAMVPVHVQQLLPQLGNRGVHLRLFEAVETVRRSEVKNVKMSEYARPSAPSLESTTRRVIVADADADGDEEEKSQYTLRAVFMFGDPDARFSLSGLQRKPMKVERARRDERPLASAHSN